ncbi:MAG: hypothetical protein ACHQ7M_06125 [Chloroflexota bacterium]|jgi:antitoxin component of MazEF toxin-antitoxin module
MELVKVRRVGSSDVVTIPRSLGAAGFEAGTEVAIDLLPSGALLVQPAAKIRESIQDIGKKVIGEHREALKILEDYDRGTGPLA